MTVATYDTEPYEFGDMFTVERFHDMCKSGCFIDYDGYGHPVKGGKMMRVDIYPSKRNQIPEDATHILWFNR